MKSDSHPFSIRIFVTSGDPDGLRVVERSNWPGKALVFPRSLLPEIKRREEFGQTGVYLLIGAREDRSGDMLYVGEGDPVRPRLESHFARKDFWNRAAFFVTTGGALNKAHVQYLESRLVERATIAKRVVLDNIQNPSQPTLNEADRADMDVFLSHMLQILPLLGVNAFEVPEKRASKRSRRFFIEAKGLRGEGYESNEGFVVLKGSQGPADTTPSMGRTVSSYYNLRMDLIDQGVLVAEGDHLIFSQDYSFNSPSAAAAVVLGRTSNGRIDWKDKSGTSLKEFQERLAEDA